MSDVTMAEAAAPTLWGPTSIPLGESRGWRVGPLNLLVERRPWEWTFRWWRDGRWLDNVLDISIPGEQMVEPEGVERRRFAFGATVDPLHLAPRLGDRSFVATPDEPFYVLPAESIRAYVSIPVWVQALVGQKRQLTVDLPVVRPHNTWFGGPTSGVLCYASRTAMRLEIDRFAALAHRALVSVDVINRGATALTVSRLNIPIPHLALMQDDRGQLRTPPVVFTRDKDEFAAVDIGTCPASWTELSPPRDHRERGPAVVQAFNAFFSRGQ